MTQTIVAVGGAGHMGSRAVRALLDEGHEVIVADLRPSTVEGAAFAEADATDAASIERVARQADVIMNFAGPYYALGDAVARAAIAAGVPYIDICDDAEATEALLALDGAAREAGAALIIGAGSSPGILNGLALRMASDLDEIDELVTTWVVGEKGESGPAPLRHFLYGISRDIPVWEDGRRTMVPAFMPGSAEEFPFPAPLGPMAVRDVGHPEPVTLPRVVSVRSVRNKGALLPRGSTEMYDLLRHLGFASDRAVAVDGARVVARDFVAALLTERHNERAGDPAQDLMGLGIRATGRIDGRRTARWLAGAGHMTMADATALPTAAAIPLLLDGAVPPGAHGAEALDPASWFPELTRIAPDAYPQLELWADDGPHATVTLADLGPAQSVPQRLV